MDEKLYISETHEWLKVIDDTATIGITDFAQKELGDIVFIEIIKKLNDKVNSKEIISTIESVKAVSDIYSPVSGTIIETNQKIVDEPSIINTSPFNDGWIVKIKLTNKNELDELLNESDYKKLISEE